LSVEYLFTFLHVRVCRSLLFARKGKTDSTDEKSVSEVLGWKLFGKIPPKLAPQKDPSGLSLDHKEMRRLDAGKLQPESVKMMSNSALIRGQVARRSDREVPSTTALILEHRPELVLCFYQQFCFVYCNCAAQCYDIIQMEHNVKC